MGVREGEVSQTFPHQKRVEGAGRGVSFIMRSYYPRSFLKLLAIGFTLIALPLVVALITNAVAIDQLANRSQQAVYRAVQATQGSRRLAERLTAMERSARQMVILGDRDLLDTYTLNRNRFLSSAESLARLPIDSEQKAALDLLVRDEAVIYATLANARPEPGELAKTIEGFVALAEAAQTITVRSSDMIDREVESMRAAAAEAQRIIWWQLLALIPVVVFLVIGFTIVIARPIRQIDSAIRRLGSGEFNTAVEVSGPEDLQYLGARLEWLRGRLTDLEQQKNRFLREVSHELKTPLTALREGAELLSEEVGGKLSSEQREIAEILRHKSIELHKLIDDLLSYGASQFHKTVLDLAPVQAKKVANRVIEDQKLTLRAKRLTVDLDVADVTLPADFDKLRIILDNLLSNAIKFSPFGGVIHVAARAAGEWAEFEVADEGPGIAPEDRGHVFDPFYQGRRTAEGLIGGTGIGLSVVREYAAAHGGDAEVVDDPSRRGARLRVRLPLAQSGSVA